tara:strand:- start:296 stop:670 length:375 start_codon:yes stop_codon:yes gene_type:complete
MSDKTLKYMKHIDESLYAILDYTREANVLFTRMVTELGDIKRDGIVVTKKVVTADEDLDADSVVIRKPGASPRVTVLEAINIVQSYINTDFSASKAGYKGLIKDLEELKNHIHRFLEDYGEDVE